MWLGEAKRVNIAPDTLKVDANDHSRDQAGNNVAILNDLEQPLILGQYGRRDEKSDQRQEKSQHAQNLIIVDGITIDFVWNTVRPGELYHDRRDKCQYNQPNMRPDRPEWLRQRPREQPGRYDTTRTLSHACAVHARAPLAGDAVDRRYLVRLLLVRGEARYAKRYP